MSREAAARFLHRLRDREAAHELASKPFEAWVEAGSREGYEFDESELSVVVSAARFLERMREDTELRDRLHGIETMEGVVAVASDLGFAFAPGDLSVLTATSPHGEDGGRELSDGELDHVAGGVGQQLLGLDLGGFMLPEA